MVRLAHQERVDKAEDMLPAVTVDPPLDHRLCRKIQVVRWARDKTLELVQKVCTFTLLLSLNRQLPTSKRVQVQKFRHWLFTYSRRFNVVMVKACISQCSGPLNSFPNPPLLSGTHVSV